MPETQIYPLQDLDEIHLDVHLKQRLKFKILPDFAQFLLDNKLHDLALLQLSLFKELRPPVFRYFYNLSDDELIKLGIPGLEKLLAALINNQSTEYIEKSLREWLNNQLPQISRNQIEAEDLTIISLIRRRIFRIYVAQYTSCFETAILVLNEIDDFTTILETISLQYLLTLQQNIYEQNQRLSKIGNWVWDLKKNILTWSTELYRIYEIENGNISEMDIASFNHPDDALKVKNLMEISKRDKTPHDFFYRIILPNGREKTLHAKGDVISNSSGEAELMLGTLQDFTTQKQNEKELEDNQFFINKIAELTPSIISVYNIRTGDCLFINRAIDTLLGYEKSSVLMEGMNFFWRIIHPDDLERVRTGYTKIVEEVNRSKWENDEHLYEFIYRLRHHKGEYRWFRTYGSVFERDKLNKIEKVINVSIDVSDQMKADYLLREKDMEVRFQEERYFRMINEVEDYAILRLSPEGIIENWNSGAEKIKGYKAGEVVGKHFRIFYSPEDQQNKLPETLINKAVKEGKALHEGWRLRKDQTKFWGSILITALHDPDGNVVGFSKVTRDLTQMKIVNDNLKEYTEKIEKSNIELEEKNKQLESFNYIVSHDLNEPIRKIKTFINKLKDDEPLTPNVEKIIAKIESSCIRMHDLIDGLLLYCQADFIHNAKSSKLDIKSSSLNILLNDVLSDFNNLIDQKEIEIRTDSLPSLIINEIQLRQVFYNLISNSIKFKKVNIPLRLNVTYCIESRTNGNEGKISLFHKISFADNGIGFDQQQAAKIFGLFQRLHDRSKYPGTGLGLAICKKIMENHGGEINASGEPDIGSIFSIYLPVTNSQSIYVNDNS